MLAYVSSNWGCLELCLEDGSKYKVEGQWVMYQGTVGRLHAIQDLSSHNGGHGMGSMKSSQAFVVDENLDIHPVKTSWLNNEYTMTLLGEAQ